MRAIRMRCDGCGDVRERWTSGLGLGKHRVLGVVCGTWSVVLDDDESSYLDDIPSLPDEDAPRYVTQVEEAQSHWEVYGRDASLGIYEAATAGEAVAMCVREAGYADAEAMCAALGDDDVILGARAVRP